MTAKSTGPTPCDLNVPGSNDYLVTVAICTRNRARFLEKAVASVVAQMQDRVEILIVNNASTDDTEKLGTELAAKNKSISYCREDELGLSAARNTSLARAKGTYVIFLDDDAVAEPGWLNSYLHFFCNLPNEHVGCAGGPVYPIFEKNPPSWWTERGVLDYRGETRQLVSKADPWGGNIAYNRRVALQLGGFDTRLGRKGTSLGAQEEADLNLRLKTAGWQVWWLPDARIGHFMPAVRLELKTLLRTEFTEGRSSVIMKLSRRAAGLARQGFLLKRFIAAPFHLLLSVVGGLASLPFSLKRSVRFLLRAARVTGQATEATRQMMQSIFLEGSDVISSAPKNQPAYVPVTTAGPERERQASPLK